MHPDAAAPTSAVGRVRRLIATGFGLGYAPVASGTAGSLPGLLFAWLLWHAAGPIAVVAGAVVVALVGVWAAHDSEEQFGGKDPSQVVVDEIAGQMVALFFVAPTPWTLVLGFLLFRACDVVKPFPARRLESLRGSPGIMVDDLVAGVYANLLLHGALYVFPAIAGQS